MPPTLDFLSCILDEISLEGLDGITLETLWQRLRDRPHFPIAVDDDSKRYFWKNIAKLKDVEMYQLPKPRAFVQIYDRYANVDPDFDEVRDPPFKVQDPHYPIVSINDGEFRGSCAMYRTRQCVTSKIRYSNEVLIMSLSQVVEEYGDYLVLVASPKARLLALIGSETNPLIDLSMEEYCLLERIGRSRYLGEVTQGENGLLSLKAIFCKQLYYYKKKLTMKNLITKQDYHTKTKKGATSTGSLFHLTRFYVLRKTNMACLLKTVCDILKDKPQNREACTKLRDQLGSKRCSFKNLNSKHFQKWLQTSTVTCKELYPNGTKKEWYTVTGEEKVMKVMQLVKHCDEENSDEETSQTAPLNVHFDYSKIAYGVPLLYQVYCLIKGAGPEGISSADLGRKMTLPKLDIRSLVRVLDRKGYISSIPRSIGRQTIFMYISTDYRNKSETYTNHKEQEKRLINDKRAISNSIKRKFDCEESTNDTSNVKKIKPEDDEREEKIILKYHEIQLENAKRENILAAEFNNIKYKVHEITKKSKFLAESRNYENATDKSNVSLVFSSSKQFTYRKFKRCNIILDSLKKDRIITTNDLQKHILQKEKDEGYNFTLDKKSVARLVDSLIENDKIKKIVVDLEFEEKNTKIEFICEQSFQTSDPRLLLAIEQAKFRCFSDLKHRNVDYLSEEKNDLQSKSNKCNSIANNLGVLKQELYQIKPSHKYSHMTPKFVRIKALHIFLYYLVYQNKNKTITTDERIIYHNSMSWKRFVPPIPDYGHRGWFLIADIYSRMPLSLFVQLVNFKKEMPTLKDYLKNEETANYLIKFLPQDLRNNLLKNRKYIFSIGVAIRVLCYMGLVSIGPEMGKQKDQVFLFVHKKATLKDTTTSPPGYIHISTGIDYDTKSCEFESEKDLEEYWRELEIVCFHTPLGKYSTAIGRTLKMVEPAIKPELMSCTKNKPFGDVSDEGIVPGDGLGAAGYDSSLFLHIRRNWETTTGSFKRKFRNSLEDEKSKSSGCSMQNLLNSQLVAKSSTRCRLQRITKHSQLMQEERKLKLEKPSRDKELKHEVKITPLGIGTENKNKVKEGKLCEPGGSFKNKIRNSLKDEKSKSSGCSMQNLLDTQLVAKSSTRCRLQRVTKHSPLMQEEQKLKLGKQSRVKKLKHDVKTTPLWIGTENKNKVREGKLCESERVKSKTENIKSLGIKNKIQSNCNQAKGVAKISSSHQSTVKNRKKRGVKLVAIKQRLLKRAPFYDNKDKLALGKLDRFRCHWSPQEDSFLLLCKVASCFLQPTAYSRTIVVHYTIVRDLLHEHVPGVSADKTSRACQRRMKYIMRNPTTVNNVKVFLEEALLDAELVKKFDDPKPPRTKVEAWKTIFTRLIDVLREKIARPATDRCTNVSIPQTLQEFNEEFGILEDNDIFRSKKVYNDPESIEDIEKSTLMFLILSAMAVENEDQWTPVLNKMYQTYPESFLQSAVAHLRKETVISVKSKAHRSDIRRLRQSTSPYKFSITYHNAKIAKFPRQSFEEAKALLNSLNSLNSKSNLELKGDVPVGFTASVLALLATQRLHIDIQTPDQILLFDSTLSKKVRTNIVDRMASTLSDTESVEFLQYLSNDNNFLVDNKCSTRTHSKFPQDGSDALQSPNLSVTDIELQTSEAQPSSKASRFALYLLRQELSQQTFEKEQYSQDYIVLNASRVFCRLKTSTPLVLPMNPPEIIEETLGWKTKPITKQWTEFKRDSNVETSNLLKGYIPSNSLGMHNNYFEEIQTLFERYQLQTVADAERVFSNLYKAGQKGSSETELWRKFTYLLGELSLFEHLRIFREAFLILRVGVAGFTYVCSCFASSWVLPSPQFTSSHKNKTHSFDCIPGEELTNKSVSLVGNKTNLTPHNRISPPNCSLTTPFEPEEFTTQGRYNQELTNSSQKTQVYFVPKTWRNPDGSLNKPVLFDLLFTLLSYLISTPGASTSKIFEYFSLILPPVQVLELLEVLENSDCIYKYYCRPIGKASLFSTPPTTFIALHPKPGDIDHIEVFPDAVCKIVKLMDVLL